MQLRLVKRRPVLLFTYPLPARDPNGDYCPAGNSGMTVLVGRPSAPEPVSLVHVASFGCMLAVRTPGAPLTAVLRRRVRALPAALAPRSWLLPERPAGTEESWSGEACPK
jgi:hypothetical protein